MLRGDYARTRLCKPLVERHDLTSGWMWTPTAPVFVNIYEVVRLCILRSNTFAGIVNYSVYTHEENFRKQSRLHFINVMVILRAIELVST